MKVFMFILIFLFIGAFFIISNENLKLNDKEDLNMFFKMYSGWFDQLLGNSKTAAGYVVKMEWLPDEGKIEK